MMAEHSDIQDCAFHERCGGCDHLGRSLDWQRERKIERCRELLFRRNLETPEPEWLQPGAFGLRDRLDFVLEDGRFGLSPKGLREITDLPDCGQLSPSLQEWLSEFRRRLPPIRRGSVRLRVGPGGERGAWLDFSHEDVRDLFAEKDYLNWLSERAFVEIGQRRKKLTMAADRPRLSDPEPRVWFETHAQSRVIPLRCLVGGFTQPSLTANRTLVGKLESWASEARAREVFEYGCGIGNLSFALWASDVGRYTALESDGAALDCFRVNIQEFQKNGGRVPAEIHLENSPRLAAPALETAELLLVDPPRSGLSREIREAIPRARELKTILSVSCFPESFADDAALFQEQGFQLLEWALLDQFPQTEHVELLGRFGR